MSVLNDDEITLIQQCKKHWESDIRQRFLQGEKALAGVPCKWEADGSLVKSMATDCPMCREYLYKDFNCDNCLFKTILSSDCGKSGGWAFAKNPCLETCDAFMLNFDKMLGGL